MCSSIWPLMINETWPGRTPPPSSSRQLLQETIWIHIFKKIDPNQLQQLQSGSPVPISENQLQEIQGGPVDYSQMQETVRIVLESIFIMHLNTRCNRETQYLVMEHV